MSRYEISRQSWHYKLMFESLRKYSGPIYAEKTLDSMTVCTYFWKLMWLVLVSVPLELIWKYVIRIALAVAGTIALTAFLLAGVTTLPIYLWVTFVQPGIELPGWYGTISIQGLVASGVFYATCLWAVLGYLRHEDKQAHPEKYEKQPSLLAQRYRDWKDKRCTLITFKD